MATIYQRVGARIAELRHELRWSQERLAEQADLTPSYVARIESGTRQATLATLERIAKSLEVDLFELFIHTKTAPRAARESIPKHFEGTLRDLNTVEFALVERIAEAVREQRHPYKKKSKRK